MAKTRAQIADHPVHPMIVVFPIAFWIGALAADIVYVATGAAAWYTFGFICMGLGILGALAAALFGGIDFFSLPRGTRAKQLALMHGLLNVVVATLFVVNFGLRYIANDGLGLPLTPPAGGTWAACVALSLVSVGLLAVSGWLGGELVYVEGVAVNQPAIYNAEQPTLRDNLRPGQAPLSSEPPRPGADDRLQ